ncbi:MAG: class I SAM-dependent methyltransferase [Melioribacteraceae bacterium]|nr:class I SAM-dependent methyltransferase [Melioribacteraceae bacterium]
MENIGKDNKNFYETFDWEKANLKFKLQKKIQILHKYIPQDVISIVDIGAGDGTITKTLQKKYKTVAVDRSKNALKFIDGNKVMASADYLPFKVKEFDLVFSSEMLEHLPDEIFIKTIEQIKYTAKKYIYLTFPNNETIEKNFIKCPVCQEVFNKSYHLRNLNIHKIQDLLENDFKLIHSFELDKPIRDYNKFLLKIKHKFSSSDSWMPENRTKSTGRDVMCPKCNHFFELTYRFSLISTLCDLINIIISKKRPYQLCVLFERNK